MRSASLTECRSSLPRHRGAPETIVRCHSRNLKIPERRRQRPRRHLQSASAAANDDVVADLRLPALDRARFPLLTSPRSPVSHFVNLTNGLEAVPTLLALGIRDFNLVRLTSTACEQRRHADFLSEASDAALLSALAAGRVALVWDTSSRERGSSSGGEEGAGDEEWREALLSDERGGGPESSSSRSSRSSRAGGGLRVPRALFWGLEFLRYACESRWNSGENLSRRAFLGEAGHDVTLDFERALRNDVPDGTKTRLRYFRRFYLRRRQREQQEQEQQEQGQEQQQRAPRDDGEGIRLWGCYRPSRLDAGGGDEASRRAQEELFDLAFSGGGGGACESGEGASGGGGSRGGGEDPPPFSREALALELADLGWGLFAGGEDRAERLRASRRRREARKREG